MRLNLSFSRSNLEKIVELFTWGLMLFILIFVRFVPQRIIGEDTSYYILGAMFGFALFYYYVAYKIFSKKGQFYLKTIADVILLGLLIHIAKDWGNFLNALYFLPIAAVAFTLNIVNPLLVAILAAGFLAFEIIWQGQFALPFFAVRTWQIGLILLVTIVCRFLALQIRAEREVKEEAIRAKILATEKEAMQKEFTALTSHQLFTPLSIIRGFSSMMLAGEVGKLDPKQKKYLKEIYAAARRMIRLISDLLSLARIEERKVGKDFRIQDLKPILQKVISFWTKEGAKKGIKIEAKIPALPRVVVDEQTISQAFNNLIANGVDYSQKGGRVKITAERKKERVIVNVRDYGIGIPLKEQGRIFQRFYRASNAPPPDTERGTGLGLFIARKIIEDHNGDIWFESEEGKGSTFSFSLPLAKQKEEL